MVAFSVDDIFAAAALGRQAGYAREPFSAPLRPQGFPVFTSTHFSPNHLPRPPLATFLDPVIRASPRAAALLVLLSSPRIGVSTGVHIELGLGFSFHARPQGRVFGDGCSQTNLLTRSSHVDTERQTQEVLGHHENALDHDYNDRKASLVPYQFYGRGQQQAVHHYHILHTQGRLPLYLLGVHLRLLHETYPDRLSSYTPHDTRGTSYLTHSVSYYGVEKTLL